MVAPFWHLMRLELDHSPPGSSFSFRRSSSNPRCWGAMLVVVYERGLHLSHVLPPFSFWWLAGFVFLGASCGFHAATFFQSATSLFFVRVGALCTVLLWSQFGSADGLTIAHPPDVPVDIAGTGGPDLFRVACDGPSELSPSRIHAVLCDSPSWSRHFGT